MSWKPGELRPFEVGRLIANRGKSGHKVKWQTYYILAPYDRIIAQLEAENECGEAYDTHESRCRQEYAKHVLDKFAQEIKSDDIDPSTFRSAVLTPILIRQLKGIHDASSETVRTLVSHSKQMATIQDATAFYLSEDPTNPSYIPIYRRQLLNIPRARWHLSVVMGRTDLKDPGPYYNRFHADHDKIMESLTGPNAYEEVDDSGNPLLNLTEVACILAERLEEFFEPELALVISPNAVIPHQSDNSLLYSTSRTSLQP